MPFRIRAAQPDDVSAIAEHHQIQNARDGTDYPMPVIFDVLGNLMPNIALAFVIMDESDKVIQGVVFERQCEMLLFGCDPHATAQLHKEIEGAFYLLRRKGYETVHCLVPKQVVIPVEKPLKKVGFERNDFRLAHFTKDLTMPERETQQ